MATIGENCPGGVLFTLTVGVPLVVAVVPWSGPLFALLWLLMWIADATERREPPDAR